PVGDSWKSGEPPGFPAMCEALSGIDAPAPDSADAVRFDPLFGKDCGPYEGSGIVVEHSISRESVEIAAHVRPADVFADARVNRRGSGFGDARAMTIFYRSLGFERLQIDLRAANAAIVAESNPAEALSMLE